jgi:hypothetical protein
MQKDAEVKQALTTQYGFPAAAATFCGAGVHGHRPGRRRDDPPRPQHTHHKQGGTSIPHSSAGTSVQAADNDGAAQGVVDKAGAAHLAKAADAARRT